MLGKHWWLFYMKAAKHDKVLTDNQYSYLIPISSIITPGDALQKKQPNP